MHKDVKDHSIAFGWVGISSVAVFFAGILACVAVDPAWSWTVSSDADKYYTFGCILGGILVALYGVGKIQYGKTIGYCFAGVMIVLAGICIALQGVFTDESVTTVSKFLFILVAIFSLIAASLCTIEQNKAGKTLYVGAVMVIVLTALCFIASAGENDMITAVTACALAWVAIDGCSIVLENILGGKN